MVRTLARPTQRSQKSAASKSALSSKATAEHWRSEYPDVDISDAQAQERAERLDVKERRLTGYMPVKGIVVPELPYKRGE